MRLSERERDTARTHERNIRIKTFDSPAKSERVIVIIVMGKKREIHRYINRERKIDKEIDR